MSALLSFILFFVVCGISHYVEKLWHVEYVDNGIDDNFTTMCLSVFYDLLVIARLVLVIAFFSQMGWYSA